MAKKLHWTQRPENLAKVKAMAKRSAKSRARGKVTFTKHGHPVRKQLLIEGQSELDSQRTSHLDAALSNAASFIAGVAHGLAIIASESLQVPHRELANRVGLALHSAQGGSSRRTRNHLPGV